MRVPVDAQGEQPPRVLTPEEAGRIIAAAYEEDGELGRSLGGPFARLAFASGLRMDELLALEYGPHGLDLEAGVVRVRASLDRVRDETGVYRRQPPKSKASRRDVPLPAETVWGATGAPARHRQARGRLRRVRSPGRRTVDTQRPVPGVPACAAKAASLEEPLPNPHDARHAYASWALAAGISVHGVARLLGHSDATLVLKRYGHALQDELAGAADTLSEWLRTRESVTGLSQPATRKAANPHG